MHFDYLNVFNHSKRWPNAHHNIINLAEQVLTGKKGIFTLPTPLSRLVCSCTLPMSVKKAEQCLLEAFSISKLYPVYLSYYYYTLNLQLTAPLEVYLHPQ